MQHPITTTTIQAQMRRQEHLQAAQRHRALAGAGRPRTLPGSPARLAVALGLVCLCAALLPGKASASVPVPTAIPSPVAAGSRTCSPTSGRR